LIAHPCITMDGLVNRVLTGVCRRDSAAVAGLLRQIDAASALEPIPPRHMYRLCEFAAIYEDTDVLEWLWRRAPDAGALTKMMIVESAPAIHTYNWLLTKIPDIYSWKHYGIWLFACEDRPEALYLYKWLHEHASVQELALIELVEGGFYGWSHRGVKHFLSLGPHPALEEAMLKYAVCKKNTRVIRTLASARPSTVRAVCLADGGRVLRRACADKTERALRETMTASDYASVGLRRLAGSTELLFL